MGVDCDCVGVKLFSACKEKVVSKDFTLEGSNDTFGLIASRHAKRGAERGEEGVGGQDIGGEGAERTGRARHLRQPMHVCELMTPMLKCNFLPR